MNALILMSRVPVAGKTKTRLIGPLTAQRAALLHQCFLHDLNLMLSAADSELSLFVSYGDEGNPALLTDIFPDRFSFFPQSGDSLGERMQNAFEEVFAKGYGKIVLIGADVPLLNLNDIEQALQALDDKQLVYGPTDDGGYYLIAMRRLIRKAFDPKIAWGSNATFAQSMNNLQEEAEIGLIRQIFDIDLIEDLTRLQDASVTGLLGPHLRDFLSEQQSLSYG